MCKHSWKGGKAAGEVHLNHRRPPIPPNMWPRCQSPLPTHPWCPIMPTPADLLYQPIRRLESLPMPETLTLVMSGYQFTLATPYEQGRPMGQAEASILNREWAQGLRTAFQPLVASTIAHSDGKLTLSQVETLQSELADFATQFAFKALASPRSVDALTKQKHEIARRVMDIRLNANGVSKEQYGEHKYEAAIARLMNSHEVIAQAQANLAASRDAADLLAGMGD